MVALDGGLLKIGVGADVVLGEIKPVVFVRLAHAQADRGLEDSKQGERQPAGEDRDREGAGDLGVDSGGGDEVRRSRFLDALQRKLGAENGRRVWEDLRQRSDPEARVAAPGTGTARSVVSGTAPEASSFSVSSRLRRCVDSSGESSPRPPR